MAKITFLGTGGDVHVVSKQVRGAGGIVLEFGANQFLLDPGISTVAATKASGVALRATVGVLVSSNDTLCASSLYETLWARSLDGLDRHGVLLAPTSVLEARDTDDVFSGFVERVIDVSGVPRIGINQIDIRVLPTHSQNDDLGFQFHHEKEIISYTGRTGLNADVIEAHRGSTTLIAHMPYTDEEVDEFSLSPEKVAALAKACGVKTLILTGFGISVLKADVRAISRDVHKASGAHVIVAEDAKPIDTKTYR